MEILNDRVLAEDILANGFAYRKCIFKQLQSVIRHLHHIGEDKEEIFAIDQISQSFYVYIKLL